MGRKDEAVSYLQQALEKGFKSIKHIESDDALITSGKCQRMSN